MKKNDLSLHEAVFGKTDIDYVVAYSENSHYTHSEFNESVKVLALYLKQYSNVSKAALCIENAYYFSIAFAALLYVKKIPVLLGNITPHTFDDIKDKADLVITDSNLDNLAVESFSFEKMLLKAIAYYHENYDNKENSEDFLIFSDLDEASPIIFYTSGTTGKSKEIKKTLRSMQIDIRSFYKISANLDKTDNLLMLSTVPNYHMFGLTYRIFMPLLRRIPMTSYMIRFPEELRKYDENIILITSPAFVKRLDTAIKAPKIKLCISAGSPMPDDAAKTFYDWCGCEITEIYGSTEHNGMGYRKTKGDNHLFTPFYCVKFIKTDDGYDIESDMADGHTKLDDYIEFEGKGFKVKGRKDKIVKIEENRVSLNQIEVLLKEHALIRDASVLVLDKNNRTCIGAVCVLKNPILRDGQSDADLDHNVKKEIVDKLKEHLKGYLPAVAIPRYYRIVNKIPVNPMGKRVTPLLEVLFDDKA